MNYSQASVVCNECFQRCVRPPRRVSLWPVAKCFATALYLLTKVPLAVWGLLTLILCYTTSYLTFTVRIKSWNDEVSRRQPRSKCQVYARTRGGVLHYEDTEITRGYINTTYFQPTSSWALFLRLKYCITYSQISYCFFYSCRYTHF